MDTVTVLNPAFVASLQAVLKERCVGGAAVTRPELVKLIRRLTNKPRAKTTDMVAFVSAAVRLGLVNTPEARFGTKRGVKGGIVRLDSGGAEPAPAEPEPAA